MRTDPVIAAQSRCVPAWPKDVLRIAFGEIWGTLRLPGFPLRLHGHDQGHGRRPAQLAAPPSASTLARLASLFHGQRNARSA